MDERIKYRSCSRDFVGEPLKSGGSGFTMLSASSVQIVERNSTFMKAQIREIWDTES